MALLMRIAVAACVVASGLFVGGAGATIAFAEPDTGQTGPSAAESGATSPTSGAAADAMPAVGTATERTSGATGTVVAPKPTARVGDARNGLASGEPGSTATEPIPSKRSTPDLKTSSQTAPTVSGEPTSGGSAQLADAPALIVAPGAPPVETPPVEPPRQDPDDPEQHLGWGWPWYWPCPPPGLPPGRPPGGVGSGGGSDGAIKPPSGLPKPPPLMQLPIPREVAPALPVISVDPLVDVVAGLGAAAAQLPFAPIALPAVVAPLGAGGAGAGGGSGAGGGPRPGTPAIPRTSGAPGSKGQSPQKANQQSPPAYNASNGLAPASFRAGYGEYLRTAGIGQIAAVAVPGVTGILMITGAGGLLGYRQARAGRALSVKDTARFVG